MGLSPSAVTLLLLSTTLLEWCLACTYFEVNTTLPGREVVIGRTMEFGKVFSITDWQVVKHPRGVVVDFGNITAGQEHKAPTKYGYVGMANNDFGVEPLSVVSDGMNEKGLSVAAQSQYRAEYQHWDLTKAMEGKKLVFTMYFVRWGLAMFANVSEMKAALLSGDYVVSNLGLPKLFSFHWAVADALGDTMVVEYERGVLKIYHNEVGVMTNDPFYPWHVENLNSYSHLSPKMDQDSGLIGLHIGDLLPGTDLVPYNMGHGFNLAGIPGDPSPPSRFVKTFYLRQISQYNSNPGNALSHWMTLAQGILNSVFIPMGATGHDTSSQIKGDYTAWATIRVPQTGFYAFRTYGNMQWHMIDLQRLDWSVHAVMYMPSEFELGVKDVTADFQPHLPTAEHGSSQSMAHGSTHGDARDKTHGNADGSLSVRAHAPHFRGSLSQGHSSSKIGDNFTDDDEN